MQRSQNNNMYTNAQIKLASKRLEDKRTAVKSLDILSAQGHAEAKFQLGMVYETRNADFKTVVEQSDVIAYEYYSQASDSGHAAASFKLGIMNAFERAEQKRQFYHSPAEHIGHGAQFIPRPLHQVDTGVQRCRAGLRLG